MNAQVNGEKGSWKKRKKVNYLKFFFTVVKITAIPIQFPQINIDFLLFSSAIHSFIHLCFSFRYTSSKGINVEFALLSRSLDSVDHFISSRVRERQSPLFVHQAERRCGRHCENCGVQEDKIELFSLSFNDTCSK